jgi:hypothetical protein
MRLLVEPIYGWGWSNLQGQSVDVPGPFELSVSILNEGHYNLVAADLEQGLTEPALHTTATIKVMGFAVAR